MSAIRFQSVGKDFGALVVLNEITLDIQSGEFVVFVGPSGCGKSTLLRILAGLESASRGNVFIGDQRVNDLPPKDRDIAMVFQNYALYPHMTVYQNLEFPLRNQSMPKPMRHEAIHAAASLLNIEAYLDRYPRELSGGQRQRVAMGRAIVREPRVFLFDEPLSNLDAALRSQMRKETKQLHRRLRSTMVFVTHDQVEAMTMADRIVVMKDGQLQQVGTPDEIYNAPANVFVAGFVGTPAMNILHGRIQGGADQPVFAVADSGAEIPLPANDTRIQDVATIGVRPEHVVVHAAGPATAEKAQVVHRESDGRDLTLTVNWGGTMISALGSDLARLSPGDPVAIELAPASMLFFDRRRQLLRLP